MSDPHENIVYGLVDPRTRLIHYIGQSTWGLNQPKAFRNESAPNTLCRKWIKELESIGLDYEIVVLARFEAATELAEAVLWWIAYGQLSHWPLTNSFRHRKGIQGPIEEAERLTYEAIPVEPGHDRKATIQIRVTKAQKKRLEKAAYEAGTTLSNWLLITAFQRIGGPP